MIELARQFRYTYTMSSRNIVAAIQFLLCALVVAVPLVFFPTGMYPFQVIKTVVFQGLVEIIFALWLGLAIAAPRYRPGFTPIIIALLVFLGVSVLSALFGVDWRASAWSDESRSLGLIAFAHFAALGIVLSAMGREVNWRRLFLLSIGTAFLVSLIAVSQVAYSGGSDANIWIQILYGNGTGPTHRPASTLNNAAFMAGYLLLNFFLALWLLGECVARVRAGKKPVIKNIEPWFLFVGALLMMLAIFLSLTLGAIFGLACGLALLLLYFLFSGYRDFHAGQTARRCALTFIVILCVFSVLFFITKGSGAWDRVPGLGKLAHTTLETASVRDRLIVWGIAWKAFLNRPLLGWGFENFRIAFNEYYNPALLQDHAGGTYWDKPHNVLFEHLVNGGIIGLLAYLGIFAALGYELFRYGGEGAPGRRYKAFFIAFFVAYLAQNLFVFDTLGTYLILFLCLGYVASRRYEARAYASAEEDSRRARLAPVAAGVCLAVALVPLYFNYEIFQASRDEYRGVNYFLNNLIESSLVSFGAGLNRPTPYLDDIRKNFANTVKQAYQQGIEYPGLKPLQAELSRMLAQVIARHPDEFFNYIARAEFLGTFYRFNPSYLEEASRLEARALELSPGRQQTYYAMAKTEALKGDTQGVFDVFRRVIALNPNAGEPHFFFGLSAYGLGDPRLGKEEIARAERLGRSPGKVEEAIALGTFVGDYDHDYKAAIRYYTMAYSMAQDTLIKKAASQAEANIDLKLAVAYYLDGQKDNARRFMLDLVKIVGDLKQVPLYRDPSFQAMLKDIGVSL